jgi:hypothetical protein
MLDRRRWWLPDSGSSHGLLSGSASAEHILFRDKLPATPLSSEARNYTLAQKLARPRATIDSITAGLALLGSRKPHSTIILAHKYARLVTADLRTEMSVI